MISPRWKFSPHRRGSRPLQETLSPQRAGWSTGRRHTARLLQEEWEEVAASLDYGKGLRFLQDLHNLPLKDLPKVKDQQLFNALVLGRHKVQGGSKANHQGQSSLGHLLLHSQTDERVSNTRTTMPMIPAPKIQTHRLPLKSSRSQSSSSTRSQELVNLCSKAASGWSQSRHLSSRQAT